MTTSLVAPPRPCSGLQGLPLPIALGFCSPYAALGITAFCCPSTSRSSARRCNYGLNTPRSMCIRLDAATSRCSASTRSKVPPPPSPCAFLSLGASSTTVLLLSSPHALRCSSRFLARGPTDRACFSPCDSFSSTRVLRVPLSEPILLRAAFDTLDWALGAII